MDDNPFLGFQQCRIDAVTMEALSAIDLFPSFGADGNIRIGRPKTELAGSERLQLAALFARGDFSTNRRISSVSSAGSI